MRITRREALKGMGALAMGMPADLELWKTLPPDSTVEDAVRNYSVRQLLWV